MALRTPFLQLVARAYARNTSATDMPDLCFVFPNKRSIAFFLRYLDEELGDSPHIEPSAVTISDLLMSMSTLAEASRYEQLFALYDEYRKLSAEVPEFDRFLFWGEMILSDFNDVDRHLVDPVQLFRNLKELREINSTYLTDEQREIIRKYWGDESPDENLSRFWTHLKKRGDTPDSTATTKFMALWEVLGPLYQAFHNRLKSQGLATDGMFYRHAAEHLADISLPFKRYIFVGFNVLTPSEVRIFERLKTRGLADFYWDYNSPAFLNERNKATRFLSQNIKSFPSLYDIGEDPVTQMPDISIIGVPSNVGQARVAGDTVERWAATGELQNTENAIDTAIVLADEALFLSLVDEIPPAISCMNVTMGFKMKLTPIAVLMKSIAKMQRNVKKVRGKLCFFFENVLQLLSNPIIRKIEPESCQRLVDYITDKRIFTIEAEIIKTGFPQLAPVFTPIADGGDFLTSADYLEKLLDFLERYTAGDDSSVEKLFITSYRQELADLMFACREYDISMHESTVLSMLDRVISSSTIPLAGEPLRGLQIMGVLETRSLDFKNVIMLSMNEAVFPRRQTKKSFIPEALRRGYGMATSDFAESIYAYYFYRLLSRASNVTLVYDARTVGMKRNNEMSRYLDQLLYLFPDAHINHSTVFFDITTFEDTPIEIPKTEDVMALLSDFLDPEGGKRLSASSINSYIRCPLGFYLEQVEGLRFPDELNDYMDYSTYGTIFHEVMQHIYEHVVSGKQSNVITDDDLRRVIESPVMIDRLVTESVNRNFIRLEKDELDSPLSGEALVMHHVMVLIVKQLLQTEIRQFTPFEFLGAEKKVSGRLKVNENVTVNFTQTIDRIDRVNGRLRFVDYKTGSDQIEAAGMDKLFNYEAHAIFQLMLYCYFYSMTTGNDEPIQPIIYKTRDLFTTGIRPLRIGKDILGDYHSAIDDFRERLEAVISEIFDPEVPFRQAEDAGACRFCKFKQICKKEE